MILDRIIATQVHLNLIFRTVKVSTSRPLNEPGAALGLPNSPVGPPLTAGMSIKASDIIELRRGVQ